MLGLAGGSALMAGRARRLVRPLRVLALLEGAIAIVCACAAVGRALHHPARRCGRRLSLGATVARAHDAGGAAAPGAAGRRDGCRIPVADRRLATLSAQHRHCLWQQHARGRSRRAAAPAAAAQPGLDTGDTRGGAFGADGRRGPIRAGLAGLAGTRTGRCATREPGERTQALGAAAPQLRHYRRREPAVGNGVAAAVQPGDAAHRICAGADPRGDAVWHGARQPDRLEALRLPIDGGVALVRLGLRHRQPVAAAHFLGLD